MECIILAGGLGTRLRSVIGEQPKCMAEVNEQPFLYYLFSLLAAQGFDHVILSLGYKSEIVIDWAEQNNWGFDLSYAIEQEPLGTGGGIQLALGKATEDDVVVLNGDTMFRVPLGEMMQFHETNSAETTLALKPMHNFERYGVVKIDDGNGITGFEEKQYREEGLINGGVYIINKPLFSKNSFPEKFSFEKDYLELQTGSGKLKGFVSREYFIDIGIPEDYKKAQTDFLSFL